MIKITSWVFSYIRSAISIRRHDTFNKNLERKRATLQIETHLQKQLDNLRYLRYFFGKKTMLLPAPLFVKNAVLMISL